MAGGSSGNTGGNGGEGYFHRTLEGTFGNAILFFFALNTSRDKVYVPIILAQEIVPV